MQSKTPKLDIKLLEKLYFREDLVVWREILGPGQSLPWHHHSHVPDVFFCIKGPITIRIKGPDEIVTLLDGEVFRLEHPRSHEVSNMSDHDIEWILVQTGGYVDYIVD